MNTTNLFVELVVIGIGVFIWVLLLVGAVFGFSWLSLDNAVMIGSALPALAVVYVSGIVWDRIADSIFEWLWADDLRAEYFTERGAYYNARRLILTNSQTLSDLLEYGRSRLRICRGWALNALMIALCLNIYLWTLRGESSAVVAISVFGTVASAVMAAGSWFAWRSLARAEYRKIKDQSRYLSEAGI